MPDDPKVAELLEINQRLLESIAEADWETYSALCDPSLTCFEAETGGTSGSRGWIFTASTSTWEPPPARRNTTMCSPHVRLSGDVAIVSYVRLNQRLDAEGKPVTAPYQETRVWQWSENGWRHVHFHRSVTHVQ